MVFDKAKVYTTFNANEVKIGSKGYFSDFKENLISHVQSEDTKYYLTIKSIEGDNDFCFRSNEGGLYRYFYLVEEPKEKAKRPCTREELLKMLREQGLPMLRFKHRTDNLTLCIKSLTDDEVSFDDYIYFGGYIGLCENYTLLDGTELWGEE